MAEPKEERSSRPPSYTEPSPAPVAAPVYTGPSPIAAPAYTDPAPQQVMFMPQGGVVPQQGYVIQNVPVPAQTGCCGGRSDGFKHRAGVTTGIIHLVVAVVSIVLSAFTIVLIDKVDRGYYGIGAAIGGAVCCFIPAGILGVLTKYKNSCVIVGYLVMTILSAIQALYVLGVEIPAAIHHSSKYDCSYISLPERVYPLPDDDMDYGRRAPAIFEEPGYNNCGPRLVVSVLVIHIALVVVSVIEFISAIVAASYCCGGLRCCCAQASRSTTMMYYTPVGTGQVAVQVAPAAGTEADPLPQKA